MQPWSGFKSLDRRFGLNRGFDTYELVAPDLVDPGAIAWLEASLANYAGATATLTDCTVSGNTAGFQGGGIQNSGSLTLTGGIVTGNDAS